MSTTRTRLDRAWRWLNDARAGEPPNPPDNCWWPFLVTLAVVAVVGALTALKGVLPAATYVSLEAAIGAAVAVVGVIGAALFLVAGFLGLLEPVRPSAPDRPLAPPRAWPRPRCGACGSIYCGRVCLDRTAR